MEPDRKSFDARKQFVLKSDAKAQRYAGAVCVLCRKGCNDSTHTLKGQRVCNNCAEGKTNLDK